MTASHLAGAKLIDDVSALRLLEGLASVYEWVIVVDREARVVWMSDAVANFLGGRHHFLGQDGRRIVSKLPRPEQVFAIRAQLRRDLHVSGMSVELKRPDGEALPVEVSILPVMTNGTDPSLFVAIARPVPATDDEPEAPAHTDVETILGAAPYAVLAVDGRGFVTYANAAAEPLLGRPVDAIVNRPVALLPVEWGGITPLLASLEPGRGVREHDLGILRDDGSEARVSVSANALPSGAGTVLMLRDVTERREQQSHLERTNAELEHCVNTLAHDLRSPLVALLGFSRLLRQDYGTRLDDTGLHFLDRIEQAGRTMESLIHDLLELSRIGQPGDRRSMVDPRTVLLQLAAELKPRLESSGCRLDLPQDPPLVFCDRTRLYQLFSNLIGNALEHMGPCDDPQVRVTIEGEGSGHRLGVRDCGRGIHPEHHERIFEIFQSLGPRKGERRGSGIGLAIVKKIAETHGGRVWVESAPGTGAAFFVHLPLG